jgi:hypothetical protein
MNHPDIPELHEVMGALLATLADVPEATIPQAEWRLGTVIRDEQISWAAFGVPDERGRDLLEQVRARLCGGTITPSDTPFRRHNGRWARAHTLRVRFRNIHVAVTAWVSEPTEREALLARLAELDAAEATEDGAS